ncbi:hypothetical protein B4U80_10283, partial [Leptotrombidium deliense]
MLEHVKSLLDSIRLPLENFKESEQIRVESKINSFKQIETHRTCPTNGKNVDISVMNNTLQAMFTKSRNHIFNKTLKDAAQHKIAEYFSLYCDDVKMQTFEMRTSHESFDGVNVIGVKHGKHKGTADDKLIIIGAHYDTVKEAPGVEDNGSGVTALLELLRVYSSRTSVSKFSVMFITFDLEEQGCLGSFVFVKEYLISEVKQSKFFGAIIMDMIMVYNPNANSQLIPEDIYECNSETVNVIKQDGNIGNFLSVMRRTVLDKDLWEQFHDSWNQHADTQKYKLFNFTVPFSFDVRDDFILNHSNFIRSDHASFWLFEKKLKTFALPALFLSDTGPFRYPTCSKYHTIEDDETQITLDNLSFLKNTVDVLLHFLLKGEE